MGDHPTLQIPKEVIEPIIQAQVALAVSTALGDGNKLMESAVKQVLEMKVNDRGEKSSYSSDIPWIQWAMHNAVRQAVKETLETELLKHKDKIKAKIVTMLQNKNSKLINELVEGMAGAMVDPSVFKYRMKIEFDK